MLAAQAGWPDSVTGQIADLLKQAEEHRYAGTYEEGLEIAAQALNLASGTNLPEREVEAHYQISLLHYFRQDFPQAQAEMDIGLARARINNLELLEADFLSALGTLEWKKGNLSLAIPKLEEAMAIRERNGDWVSMANITNNMGIISYSLKNFEDAARFYKQGLEFLGDRENDRLRGSLLSNLAEVLIPLGMLDEAEKYLYLALELDKQRGEAHGLAYTYFNLGELRSKKGDPKAAVALYQKAIDLQQSIGDNWAISLSRLRCAEEHWLQEEKELALAELDVGYDLAKSLNAISLLRDYAFLYAEIHSRTGNQDLALFYQNLHGWLDRRTQNGGNNPPPPASQLSSMMAPPEQTSDTISPLQTGIIFILIVLIGILIVENTRLRKRANVL